MRFIGPISAPAANSHMAFFQAYFDESGKFQNDNVVSFCGFMNPASGWATFEDEWNYLLRRHRIKELHISKSDLNATTAQINMYRSFIHVIKKYVECGFGSTVDVKAFAAAHKVVKKEFRDDPHYMAFYTVIRDVVKHVKVLPNPSVSIICDDEPAKACDTYKMFDVMRQSAVQPDNRKTLKSITFADSKFYNPLQAADLFAWIGRAESLFRFFGKEYSLRVLHKELALPFVDSRIIWKTSLWDAGHIHEFSQNSIKRLKIKE